jgi:hypothetical protein
MGFVGSVKLFFKSNIVLLTDFSKAEKLIKLEVIFQN